MVAEQEDKPLSVELAFYWYAHGPTKERTQWLKRLKRILVDGIRSKGWVLTGDVERATGDGHPANSWLGKLAAVIADEANINSLKNWKVWQNAE